MYVTVSSPFLSVIFVTTKEFRAAIDTLYGLVPPVIASPSGSHGLRRRLVTLGVIVILADGSGGIQLSSFP